MTEPRRLRLKTQSKQNKKWFAWRPDGEAEHLGRVVLRWVGPGEPTPMSLSSFSSCFPVDTTPTQTHANAHFSRAQIIVRNSYSTALFQCGHTALAQGEKEFVPRIRLHSFPYRLTCRC